MKTNNKIFNLSAVRNAVKNAKTPCALVKTLYIYAESDQGAELRAILPAKKQNLIDKIPAICNAYNVGGTRTVKTKDGGERVQTIRFSIDMVLRYICSTHNSDVRDMERASKAEARAKAAKEREERKAAEEKAKAERKEERARAKAERDQKKVEKALQKSTIAPEKPQTKPAAKPNAKKGAKGHKAA